MWYISKIRSGFKKHTNLTIDKEGVYVCKGCGDCLLKIGSDLVPLIQLVRFDRYVSQALVSVIKARPIILAAR